VSDGVGAYSLGVDLGTTFVAAAVARGSRVEMITLGDRTVVAPAVVYARDDGSLVTGEAANRRTVSNPDRVGREFKRRLGDPTPVMLGGTPHAVTSLLAALLSETVAKVTETEGAPPANIVLTHPANWGPYRRELFEEVPQLAGVPEVRMITEPEAAAAHYAAARHLADGDTVAVYDLGGGTFDATVLRKRAGGIDILGSPEGIERLGGVDFDDAILAHINFSSGGALSELDLSNPQTGIALARLRQDCIAAKEALSIDTEASIPVFLPNRHFDVRLTRGEFEDMIRAQIESTIGALTRTLRSARVEPTDLSAVLLVGGSSRIPLVAQMITAALNRPTLVDAHPKYAVALGAATVGAELGAPDARVDGGARASAPPVPTEARAVSAPSAPPPAAAPPPPAEPADAAPVGALAPAAAFGAGWIGGRAPEGGFGTSPFGSVDSPAAPPEPPATESRPGEPPYPDLPPPPYNGGAPENGNGAWSPPTSVTPAAGFTGGTGGPPPPPPPRRTAGSSRRRPLIVAALVAALVLLAGGVTYVLLRPPSATSGVTASAPTPVLLPPPAQKQPDKQLTVAASVPIPAIAGEIPVGSTPGYVAIAPNGTFAYVANRAAGVVTVVDTAIDKVGRDDPAAGRPAAVPRVRPRRLAALRQRVPGLGPVDQRGGRPRHPDQHRAHHDQGRHPALRAGREAGRIGDLRPEPRLGHRVGDRDQGRHARHRHPGQAEPTLGRLLQGRHPGLRGQPRLEPDQRDRHRHARGRRRDPGGAQPAQRCGAPEPAAGRERQLRQQLGHRDRHEHREGGRDGSGRHAPPGRHLGAGRAAPVRDERRQRQHDRHRRGRLEGHRHHPHR
jgi:actin-like ATPase involved in cell morphogenesis